MALAVEYRTAQEAKAKQERKQDIIDREIESLTRILGHVPTSQELLKAATSKKHPLHRYFEWNDAVAAHKHRVEEAHRMLMSCEFVVQLQKGQGQMVRLRKLVVVNKGEPMRLRNEAMAEPDARAKMTAQALSELRSWCRRYVDLPDVEKIRTQLQSILG